MESNPRQVENKERLMSWKLAEDTQQYHNMRQRVKEMGRRERLLDLGVGRFWRLLNNTVA